MPSQRFLIAPLKGGLQTDVRPWLLPENAFAELRNMYVFRDRVRKRFGGVLTSDNDSAIDIDLATLTSRMRINVGTTDANGDFAIAPVATDITPAIGQLFSCGDTIFTVYQDGTMKVVAPGRATTSTGTFDFGTNNLTIGGSDGGIATTTIYFYPALPIMGIINNETDSINDEPTYVFDTRYAYFFQNNGWERLAGAAAPGDDVWSGGDADFFWAETARTSTGSVLGVFVTNFVRADRIRYYQVSTGQWATLRPSFDGGTNFIDSARCIKYFQGRLLLFNTLESQSGGIQFGNRVRYSQVGDPTAANAFQEIAGRGDFLDAPTSQQITSVDILKDRCIVYFERSTWELVYTGNDAEPFRWQQLNSEYGSESTFSLVPFDRFTLGVSQVGVIACNGINVERIDEKIPDTVFEIHNENDGVKRVHGIRDYFTEMVYWAFPSDFYDDKFPTRVLAYNYRNKTWSIFDDSITTFGYFQAVNDATWRSSPELWEEARFKWSSGTQQGLFNQVLAGNQQGFVFVVDHGVTRNSQSLQITDISTATNVFTVINHNIQVGEYVAVETVQGTTVTGVDGNDTIFCVANTGTNTITLQGITLSGTYTGGGTISRVSQPDMLTKQYNFFIGNGFNSEVSHTDIYIDKTESGEFRLDAMASSSDEVLSSTVVETRPYDVTFAPMEQNQSQLWHRAYMDCNGNVFQFRFYFDDEQMRTNAVAWSDLVFHAFMFHVSSTASRLQ